MTIIQDNTLRLTNVLKATYDVYFLHVGGERWRSWLRRCITRQDVTGSILGGVLENFQVIQSVCPHPVALRYTQPLTEMSTEEFPWGENCDRRLEPTTLPSEMCRMSSQG